MNNDTGNVPAARIDVSAGELDGSLHVTDRAVIDAFTSNADNTFLVSFPRTGSHWLRMLMELYFQRPSLVRVFFYPERTDYLTLHTHDMDLTIERRNVIYLYRDPVATVYSQLSYYREDIHDPERIRHWSSLYGRHLAKWLIQERFTVWKTVISYDRMTANGGSEFSKVCRHFGVALDNERLDKACAQVTKERLQRKTTHDPKVVDLSEAYREKRFLFQERHTKTIREVVYAQEPALAGIL